MTDDATFVASQLELPVLGNPFHHLGVSPRDGRHRIVEAAEEKSLSLDIDVCSKAKTDLTNPRNRLAAETAWLPGISPRRAQQLIETLIQNPYAVFDAEGLPQLQEQRRTLQQTAADAQQFWSAATGQFGRLEALDLLEDDEQDHACSICRSDLQDQAEPTAALRAAMNELRRDIGEVTHDRPRLDRYLLELDRQIDELKAEQQQGSRRLNELIRLDAQLERDRGLDEARLRLAGQVELYLASFNIENLAIEEAEVQRLRDTIAELERDASTANVADDMNEDAVLISSDMRGIIADLPFAAEYRDAVPIFDWKHLQIHLKADGDRKVPMPAIGSDENYLAIHLAFFLAIQKLFSIRNRPVLQFIILDQVTRPYFPDTEFAEIVELPSQNARSDDAPQQRRLSDEAAKVRRIFDLLFKQARSPHAPQIIICEKANFHRDPDYQAAIVTFWASPQGMVPTDWPTEP
jgi:hypothetical protein